MQRCPHCGGQALGCVGFDPNDPGREPWTGKWPGEADCERLGYFINDDRDFPDLDRLFRECDWNRERQRWEDRPTRAERRDGALTSARQDRTPFGPTTLAYAVTRAGLRHAP